MSRHCAYFIYNLKSQASSRFARTSLAPLEISSKPQETKSTLKAAHLTFWVHMGRGAISTWDVVRHEVENGH